VGTFKRFLYSYHKNLYKVAKPVARLSLKICHFTEHNLKVHHYKPVKFGWKETACFNLFNYSSKLNPKVRFNAGLKRAIYATIFVRIYANLKTVTTGHMQIS
jgi:hypothetical protein